MIQNMQREETKLFPLARRILTEEDWKFIATSTPKAADPLFGERVEERYRTLHGQIAAQVGCDCVIV